MFRSLVAGCALIVALASPGVCQDSASAQDLLVRGARLRYDSNFTMAIVVLDSAAFTKVPRIRYAALFQGYVLRFQLASRALEVARRQHSCPLAREAMRWIAAADTTRAQKDSVPYRPSCVDCNNDQLAYYMREMQREARRLCR
jgi:hypothetical protein